MSPLIKNAIMLSGLVAVAAIGYYLFLVKDDSIISVDNEEISRQVEAETQEFLRRLNELKTIELSGAIFVDERFTSLTDYERPVVQETVGRSNPFSPIN